MLSYTAINCWMWAAFLQDVVRVCGVCVGEPKFRGGEITCCVHGTLHGSPSSDTLQLFESFREEQTSTLQKSGTH